MAERPVLDRTEIMPAMATANRTAIAKTANESESPKPDWLRVDLAAAQGAAIAIVAGGIVGGGCGVEVGTKLCVTSDADTTRVVSVDSTAGARLAEIAAGA